VRSSRERKKERKGREGGIILFTRKTRKKGKVGKKKGMSNRSVARSIRNEKEGGEERKVPDLPRLPLSRQGKINAGRKWKKKRRRGKDYIYFLAKSEEKKKEGGGGFISFTLGREKRKEKWGKGGERRVG